MFLRFHSSSAHALIVSRYRFDIFFYKLFLFSKERRFREFKRTNALIYDSLFYIETASQKIFNKIYFNGIAYVKADDIALQNICITLMDYGENGLGQCVYV